LQTERSPVKARIATPFLIGALNPLKKVILIVPRFFPSDVVQIPDVVVGGLWSSRFQDFAPLPVFLSFPGFFGQAPK
jgi:hypothetical protein